MMKRDLILKWIDQALVQELHSKLFIPAEAKEDATKLKNAFHKELEIMYKIDPEKASTLLLGVVRKDKRWWLVIERVIGNVLTGFVKGPDGTLSRIHIDYDPERERRIELMIEEGYSLEQVEEYEGELTELEKATYFTKGDRCE